MILDILQLLGGLILIVAGANYFTDGASHMARRLNISPLVIGLTIVAFGTSSPELVVSVSAAIKGSTDVAMGNVLGSNIANILLILGLTALVTPLRVAKSTMIAELPSLLILTILMIVMGMDGTLFNGGTNQLDQIDGVVLLTFCGFFLAYTLYIGRQKEKRHPELNLAVDTPDKKEETTKAWWFSLLLLLGGLGMLVFGGHLFTRSSISLARSWGVSEAVIGITLVALGTSLPELATSIVAARKQEVDIAVGNIVGSNLLNILLILGTTAVVKPIPLALQPGGISAVDLGMAILAVALLFAFTLFFKKRTITRVEGGILFLLYIGYTGYLLTFQ